MICLGTVIISFAEFFVFCKVELELIALSKNTSIGFGYFRLSMAIGAFCSNVIGGMLFQYFDQIGEIKDFWYLISIQSVVLGIISLFIEQKKKYLGSKISKKLVKTTLQQRNT